MNKFLIVRTDRIGDVVLTLPMAKLLKEKYPGSKVSFMCAPYTAPVVRACPFVDEIIEVIAEGKKIPVFRNIEQLKGKSFDNIFVVSPRLEFALIFLLAGYSKITGNGYRLYSVLFTNRIYEHRSKVEKHELDYNLNMLYSEFQPVEYKKNIAVCLSVNEKLKTRGAEILQESGIDSERELIILHPGSGGSSVDLPPAKMKELAKNLSEDSRYSVLITGTSNETQLCSKIAEGTEAKILNGEHSLEEFLGIISNSRILIANSTGPIHIAAAMDKYTIGFYPKIKVTSAKRWGPYSDKGFVFEPELKCENCTREQCERLNCMNTIDTEKVLNLIKKL